MIPSYWLCALLGIAVCSAVMIRRRKDFAELEQVDITNTAALACVGMVAGARILYLITISPLLIRNFAVLKADHALAYEVLSNGMVSYGGILGAVLTIFLYTRCYRLDTGVMLDCFAPLFPLFHSFGRVGCFLTGCCYGIPSDSCGLEFNNSVIAPHDISLFPVQLLCAALNLMLFAAVYIYEKKHHRSGTAVLFYLSVYAAGRFAVEFLRGDELRGIAAGLSTAQWISIMVLLAILARHISISIQRRQKAEH